MADAILWTKSFSVQTKSFWSRWTKSLTGPWLSSCHCLGSTQVSGCKLSPSVERHRHKETQGETGRHRKTQTQGDTGTSKQPNTETWTQTLDSQQRPDPMSRDYIICHKRLLLLFFLVFWGWMKDIQQICFPFLKRAFIFICKNNWWWWRWPLGEKKKSLDNICAQLMPLSHGPDIPTCNLAWKATLLLLWTKSFFFFNMPALSHGPDIPTTYEMVTPSVLQYKGHLLHVPIPLNLYWYTCGCIF